MTRFVNGFKTAVLLAALTGLCMAIGSIWGYHGVYVGLLIGLVSNGVAYFFSDKIALAAMRAQPVGEQDAPQLVRLVADLAARADLPMPKVYISPHRAPNAFATGRNPRHGVVCVTAGLLEAMSPDELAGVLAHELAHIKNRDILISTVAATIAGAITMLAYMAMWFGGGGDNRREGHPLAGLLMVILAPLAATLIQLAISRSREYAADADGARIAGSPQGLANALARLDAMNHRIPMNVSPSHQSLFIVKPLTGSGMTQLFSTHPSTEQRIARLLGR